ncbi:MAG: hypothetical protein ABI306_07945 [Caulobacteraceae bacterium]
MTECILHIGVEKTGSTSVQATLSKNRQKLRAHGVLYPEALGEKNHVKAYAFASESGVDELKSPWGLDNPAAIARFRNQLTAQLTQEVRAARPKVFCVSNEHCSSRLLARSEIERLADLLGGLADTVKVVVYLRRQGDALRSAYSTYIKTGGTDHFDLPGPEEIKRKYDYEAILGRWAAVFGEGAMDVRLFDRETLKDGDVVADFVAGLGINPREFILEKEMNKSLGSLGLEFLRIFNARVPYTADNAFNPLRGNIQELVEQFTSGDPYEGDGAAMSAFDETMAAGNERVRARYFPNRDGPLFAPVNRAAAVAGPEAPLEGAMALMAQVWEAKQKQVLQLRTRIAKLTGGKG